jgi:MFS family permease
VQIGNIFALAGLAQAGVSLPAGILADRWGRRQMMLAGLGAGLAGVTLMALAPSLYWFAAGMFVYWLTGMVLPALASYVAAARGRMPPERALTLTSAGFGLGTVLSPTLGGWIASAFGFRPLFVLAGVLLVLAGSILSQTRPQPAAPRGSRGRFDLLLANRRFLAFCALIAGIWFVVYLGLPLAPNFLASVRGLTVAQIGLLGTASAIGLTVLNLTLGRQPPRRAFLLAQLLSGVFLVIMLSGRWFGWIALAYFLRPAAFVARTLAEARATRVVARAQWGIAFGVLETVSTIASVLAPLVAGRLYAAAPARPFHVRLALLPLTMLLAYFFMRGRDEAEEDEAAEALPADAAELAE